MGTAAAERSAMSVPAGRRWIFRDLEVHGTAAGTFYLGITTTTLLVVELAGATGGGFHGSWHGRLVAYAGETVVWWSVPTGFESAMTGYDFAA